MEERPKMMILMMMIMIAAEVRRLRERGRGKARRTPSSTSSTSSTSSSRFHSLRRRIEIGFVFDFADLLIHFQHIVILGFMIALLVIFWFYAFDINEEKQSALDYMKWDFASGKNRMLHRLKASYLYSYDDNPKDLISSSASMICIVCSCLLFASLASANLHFCETNSDYKWSMTIIVDIFKPNKRDYKAINEVKEFVHLEEADLNDWVLKKGMEDMKRWIETEVGKTRGTRCESRSVVRVREILRILRVSVVAAPSVPSMSGLFATQEADTPMVVTTFALLTIAAVIPEATVVPRMQTDIVPATSAEYDTKATAEARQWLEFKRHDLAVFYGGINVTATEQFLKSHKKIYSIITTEERVTTPISCAIRYARPRPMQAPSHHLVT
ncbi:hypothetical protein Sjap_007088 [Stephania japonica]|uniref:Uncharacterized protein n=1 Tax=Stephania japonica TaxID=461633 RepID=A0AAP0K896_9MAGN